MSKHKPDAKEAFQDFCDMWDQACENGIFDDAPEEPNHQRSTLGFGTTPREEESDFEHDDPYHNYKDYEDELMQEEEIANPVFPDSVGNDSSFPKPVWVGMDGAFDKLVNLKKKLYDIECKLAEEYGGGKKWVEKNYQPNSKKLLSQIESIRRQADDLSNTLGLESEPKASMRKISKK